MSGRQALASALLFAPYPPPQSQQLECVCLETTSALVFLGTCLVVKVVAVVRLNVLEETRMLPVPNKFLT